ncbi:PilW family protein [Ramlibacter sp. AW1]|uniref:PilW family protein n=1 Tax=Ramlibacter aurantiacus TaxID=2801330 RepID=A0A937D723_9BURK|nr:PilW family protein [Ramlibacter aurantiacus]MBL0420486.1 PilW family protein [Ramlibacter aurantiacus]
MKRAAQAGIGLIELLVAMAIGLFVLGAVLTAYRSSANSGRMTAALASMTEEAQLALQLMSRDVQMAGLVNVKQVDDVNGQLAFKQTAFNPIKGCDNALADATVGFANATCHANATNGKGDQGPAIEVNLELDPFTSALTGANLPIDCTGTSIPAADPQSASHRYFVRTVDGIPSLYCGSDRGNPEPLIENVSALGLRYGEASNWNRADRSTQHPVRYVTAADVTNWSQVVAVRICVLMRSASPVLTDEDDLGYTDCSGLAQTPSDKRLYRAFFSTAAVRRKVAN